MNKIKQVLKQHSQLNHFVSWVYSFVHNFGHLQRRVRCKGAYLNGVRFSIAVGSSVEIGNLARLHNCSFSISGKNSRIIIGGGEHCDLQYFFLLRR